MRRSQSLLGLVGLILVVFGGIALYFTGALSLYVLVHLGVGAALLVYFLAARFGDLGQLLSSRSTKYGANMVVSSVLFIVLLVAANWLGTRYNKRFDLSEAGAFSLAPQAKSVLEGVDSDVELQAFLEGGHDPQIEAILDSFASASPRVKTKLIDPDKQPELAEKYGVRAYRTVRVAFKDQATTVSQASEESLTNAIIKVTRQKKENVCFVEGAGEPSIDDTQDPGGYGEAKAALAAENYDVKKVFLAQDAKVPDDCNVLALVAPEKPLTDEEVKAIGDFLGKGGRVLLLLSPGTGAQLKPLLAKYGVAVGDDVVIDQVVDLFRGPQKVMEQYVSTYGAHPITKDLKERTLFRFTRSVSPGDAKPGLTVTSIAKSSQSSWAETDLPRLFKDSQAELDEGKDTKGPISIAVAVDAKLKELGLGDGEARLVVFGTGKLGDNRNINQFFNRDLLLNSVGWLGSQEELLSIRPRTVRASRVRFTQDQATVIFYLSVLVLPEILLVAGLAVWWRRSSL
ncbi:MAG TPA: Gldg family protein [Candidatus Binatia bacterium]|nr:Gldg family protein [Candidatus Binatia bacterium]